MHPKGPEAKAREEAKESVLHVANKATLHGIALVQGKDPYATNVASQAISPENARRKQADYFKPSRGGRAVGAAQVEKEEKETWAKGVEVMENEEDSGIGGTKEGSGTNTSIKVQIAHSTYNPTIRGNNWATEAGIPEVAPKTAACAVPRQPPHSIQHAAQIPEKKAS